MAGSPPSSRSWLARAAASAGPVKALAGAAVAVIGLLAVVVPLLAGGGGGGGGGERSAEFLEGRLTQPMLRGDFERLRAVLAGEAPATAPAGEDASDAWPGAWISLRLVLRGVERTRFTWAVLERGTNDVAFTSADAGTSAAGPPPSEAGTPVQADVWVPFPARLGRFVVAVYLLPATGGRLDEYVSPTFRVASLPGGAGEAPARAPTPSPEPSPSPNPSDERQPTAPAAPAPSPAPPARAPEDLPAIDVPGPVFSTPS